MQNSFPSMNWFFKDFKGTTMIILSVMNFSIPAIDEFEQKRKLPNERTL